MIWLSIRCEHMHNLQFSNSVSTYVLFINVDIDGTTLFVRDVHGSIICDCPNLETAQVDGMRGLQCMYTLSCCSKADIWLVDKAPVKISVSHCAPGSTDLQRKLSFD